MFRKIYLKIKRYFFYKFFGFYPEDLRKLNYVQKYLEHIHKEDINYKDYLSAHFKK